jgi:hypothetical protein
MTVQLRNNIRDTLRDTGVALNVAKAMVARWQTRLGNDVQVLLSGSLVSGLFVWDEDTEVIDVDVKFLVAEEKVLDSQMWKRIEEATGLVFRKLRPMSNEPDETLGPGVLFENRFWVDGVAIALEVEGALRNTQYTSCAHLYPQVFAADELVKIIIRKAVLKAEARQTGDKTAYKDYKATVRREADRRIFARGLTPSQTK